MALSKEPLSLGLLAAILIVPILILSALILATRESRTPPPPITGLTATNASYERHGQVDLSWNPSDANDFAYYNIYASEEEIADVTELAPIGQINDRADATYQATRYRVPGLRLALFAFMEDTEYWFAVTAMDSAANESKVAISVSATIEMMPPAPPAPIPQIPSIFIKVISFKPYTGFQPATVTVPIGTTVGWANIDETNIDCKFLAEPHTVTSDTGLFHGELEDLLGAIWSYTFTEAGVFSYHCEYHPEETGKVIVQEQVDGGGAG